MEDTTTTSGGEDTTALSECADLSENKSFPFFKLPREMRDMVYSYLLPTRHKRRSSDVEKAKGRVRVYFGLDLSYQLVSHEFNEEYWWTVRRGCPVGVCMRSSRLPTTQWLGLLPLVYRPHCRKLSFRVLIRSVDDITSKVKQLLATISAMQHCLPALGSVDFLYSMRTAIWQRMGSTFRQSIRELLNPETQGGLQIKSSLEVWHPIVSSVDRSDSWLIQRLKDDQSNRIFYDAIPSEDPYQWEGLSLKVRWFGSFDWKRFEEQLRAEEEEELWEEVEEVEEEEGGQ